MIKEDFTKYTKIDKNDRIKIITPYRIDFTAHSEDAYLYKDIDPKKTDFTTKVTIKPRMNGGGFVLFIFYSITNEIKGVKYHRDNKKDCIWICMELCEGEPRFAIYKEGKVKKQHNGPNLIWDLDYHVVIKKTKTLITLKAYTDKRLKKEVTSLTVPLPDEPIFKYLLVCNNWYDDAWEQPMWFRGNIKDMEIY